MKALYGLKQAPRAWSSKFSRVLADIGLFPTPSDPCVFTDKGKSTSVVTYVDDGIVFATTDKRCREIVEQINLHVKANIVDGSIFLGIEIQRDGGRISLHRALVEIHSAGKELFLDSLLFDWNTVCITKLVFVFKDRRWLFAGHTKSFDHFLNVIPLMQQDTFLVDFVLETYKLVVLD